MVFGRRRPARPVATWQGRPLAHLRVFVPVDSSGRLHGSWDHEQFYVQARWADEPHENMPGVTYQEMTVRELCNRLPAGAEAGLGILGGSLDCAHPEELDLMPRQLDVGALSGRTRVRLVHPERYGMELDPMGPLAAARLAEVVDTVSMLSGVIMVHDAIDQAVVSAFRSACLRADLVAPLQLWQTTDLPDWFQSAVSG